MGRESRIPYHLLELEIARNPASPAHVQPTLSDTDRVILDIGCGIGQTLVATELTGDRFLIGLDLDHSALAYGRSRFPNVHFVKGTGNRLPFKSNSVDIVLSRVSLAYMDIPRALVEFRRVLREGGRVWLVLHPVSMTVGHLKAAILGFKPRNVAYHTYVMLNGLSLHLTGRLFAVPGIGRMESFQTGAGMRRVLEGAGFEDITIERSGHFVIKARGAAR